MGITMFDMIVMLRYPQELQRGARALTYGRIEVNHITPALARKAFSKHGRTFVNLDGVADDELISDTTYFRNFGFEEIQHVDIDAIEGANLKFDLAETHDAHPLYGAFDAVFDFGTIEHVFDIRAFMENTVRFLKIGGRVYHSTIANGLMEHGFYQIGPSLFFDYYSTNNLRLSHLLLHLRDSAAALTGNFMPYDAGRCLTVQDIEAEFGRHIVAVFAGAERTSESTYDRKPFQHNILMRNELIRQICKDK